MIEATPTERKIIPHIVDGRTNKEIARDLGISEATVKVHLKSLLLRNRLKNRTQLAVAAVRETAVAA